MHAFEFYANKNIHWINILARAFNYSFPFKIIHRIQ